MFSIVIPIYKSEMNIPDLMVALNDLVPKFESAVEVIFVIDGSPDQSEDLIRKELVKGKYPSSIITLSRNFGSFSAVKAGLEVAKGDGIGVIAADLQEPPEILLEFNKKIKEEKVDVVFGKRVDRKDPLLSSVLSGFFWWFYRLFINSDVPEGGVDVFGISRKVKESIMNLSESNSSLLGLLFWVGFKRDTVEYQRRERQKGKSAWTFSAKLKYLMDSIFSFTDLPIKLVMRLGIIAIITSFFLGCTILFSRITGKIQLPGYTPIVLILTTFTGFNALISAIIGNYVWRAFENTKQRPNSIVQNVEVFDQVA